jgi:hypothetical protein
VGPRDPSRHRRHSDDEEDHDVVLGWLSKLVLVLSVLGLLGLDGFAWVSARVGAEDSAEKAGRAAASTWASSKHLQAAYDAALAEVAASGDAIDPASFTAAPDGTVTLTLRREADTLVLHRVPRLRHLTELTATVVTRPAP